MRCTYCGAELAAKTTRRRFCSSKCRAAAWQRARVTMPAVEAKVIRAHLTAALEAVDEAKTILERYRG